MTERNGGKKAPAKGRRGRDKMKELERRARARGLKPFKSVKDYATSTPEAADELLAAIREMRESDPE